MKTIKMLIIVAIIFLFATSFAGSGWGEDVAVDTHQSDIEKLKNRRMQVAVEIQLLQLEGQIIVDEMNKLQDKAKKLAPKIDKLRKEFKDLTDKINKAEK